MAKKRTINRNLIGAGKQFKAIKDKDGKTNFVKSIQRQSGKPSPQVSKHKSKEQVYPPPPPSGTKKTSVKTQSPKEASTKTTARSKGLQKMKTQITKSTSTKSQPTKNKTVKKKPPTKGKGR